jgi:nucleotide-binding universal stress UspA family protein
MKINKILAPTDLSAASLEGLRYALNQAVAANAEIIVYNVIGTYEVAPYYALEDSYMPNGFPSVIELVTERKKEVTAFLRNCLSAFAASARFRVEVGVGVPYQQIIETAAKEAVDMIVMSTHGRTGFVHALIGSVAEKVVRLATCPVLTVRPVKAGSERAAA